MAWYSWFSHMYDGALERIYAPHRAVAYADVDFADRGLIVPCGTGQDLPYFVDRVGELVGVDLSPGMVERARERVTREGWQNVELVCGDVLDFADGDFDLVVWPLGLTVVPDFEAAFDHTWALLREGGRMIVFDAWAEQRTFQTWQVEKIAQADLNRKVWEPLESRSEDFALRFIEDANPRTFGGKLFVASGRRRP